MIFVDGENLTLRYQAMAAAGGTPRPGVRHLRDTYVWVNEIVMHSPWNLSRVSYYTSVTGDDPRIHAVEDELKGIQYNYIGGFGFINPHVFKKQKRGDKTKSVDINLVTDILRHTYNESVDEVVICSGDGDYLPTIRDVMRKGVRVHVAAFSSGLDRRMRTQTDEFIDLDPFFF